MSNPIFVKTAMPPEVLVGYSAGDLREMGAQVAAHVPDCATLRLIDGVAQFEWVSVSLVIGAERKSPP